MHDDRKDHGFLPQPDPAHDLRFDISAKPKESFAGSLTTKMIIGAIVTTALTVIVAVRSIARGNGKPVQFDPWIATIVVVCSFIAGAMLGALLHLKDHVSSRIATGQQVSTPLRLFFGLGVRSVLFVWLPLVFFAFLIVLPIVLVFIPL